MAHVGSKGFYVSELKKVGISREPRTNVKLESLKSSQLLNLYLKYVEEK